MVQYVEIDVKVSQAVTVSFVDVSQAVTQMVETEVAVEQIIVVSSDNTDVEQVEVHVVVR